MTRTDGGYADETARHYGKSGHHLAPGGGSAWWFLDTRVTIMADGAQTRRAFILVEFSALPGAGPASRRCRAAGKRDRRTAPQPDGSLAEPYPVGRTRLIR